MRICGGLGIDIGDRTADRADLEEEHRSAVDHPGGRRRNARRDVLDETGTGDGLTLPIVSARWGVHNLGMGDDLRRVVEQRGDLRQWLQPVKYHIGIVVVHHSENLGDGALPRAGTTHRQEARQIPRRGLDRRPPSFEESRGVGRVDDRLPISDVAHIIGVERTTLQCPGSPLPL